MRWSRLSLGLAALAVLLVAPGGAAAAGKPPGAKPHTASSAQVLSASIDNVRLTKATEAHPLVVRPQHGLDVSLTVSNITGHVLDVRSVDLEGHIAGLTFFSFDTEVEFNVARSQHKTLNYVLDAQSLDGQATGLVPSELVLAGAHGNTLASEAFISNVHGSLWSVYGLFGLGIFVLTLLALMEVVLALARGRLPVNRWKRGTRFLGVGMGTGGIFVFSASAVGKWLPSGGHWLVILAIAAAAGFSLGYLTPTPVPPVEVDIDIQESEENLARPEGSGSGWGDGTSTRLGGLSELKA